MEDRSDSVARGAWRWYLAAVGALVGILVALNAAVRDGGSAAVLRPASTRLTPELAAFAAVIAVAAVGGLALAIAFLVTQGGRLAAARRPRIQPSVLLIGFLTYFAGTFVLAGFFGIIVALLRIRQDTSESAAVYLVGQAFTMLGALALALSMLRWLTSYTLEDSREIGYRIGPIRGMLAWGIGGYCASLPFVGTAAVISLVVSRFLFKHIPTPEHPIVPMVLKGGAAFAMAVVIAAVIAPIVEETFFRGMLYNALRASMGVGGASILSGAVFAIIHPTLPAGFLPILVLGIVLAVLRERTGSLVPSMICHAMHNTVLLVFAKLVYGQEHRL